MKNVYIIAAKRTPFGRYRGILADRSAIDLGIMALAGTLKSAGLHRRQIEALFMGNVLSAGLGQNIARQIALKAGLPAKATAVTVNDVSGSSLKALRMAQGQITMGDFDLVAAGGTESMTNAAYLVPKSEKADPADHLQNSLLVDGLNDAFLRQPMGVTAEKVAAQYQVTRADMDRFSLTSHQKAAQAVRHKDFKDEIIPLLLNKQALLQDENICVDTSLAKLAALKPIFRANGVVTAGNSAPISDGASMVILASQDKVAQLGLKPRAKLGAYAEAGFKPELMGYTPYYAIQKVLQKTGRQINDYDAIEIDEAFAASTIAVARDLKVPQEKLNILGGDIALGHPLAATGTRLIATVLSSLKKVKGQRGLIALSIGGGQAIAYEVERLE